MAGRGVDIKLGDGVLDARRPLRPRHRAPRVAPDRQPAARPLGPPGRPRRDALLPLRRRTTSSASSPATGSAGSWIASRSRRTSRWRRRSSPGRSRARRRRSRSRTSSCARTSSSTTTSSTGTASGSTSSAARCSRARTCPSRSGSWIDEVVEDTVNVFTARSYARGLGSRGAHEGDGAALPDGDHRSRAARGPRRDLPRGADRGVPDRRARRVRRRRRRSSAPS